MTLKVGTRNVANYEIYAPRLAEKLYDPIPCQGKRPFIKGWNNRPKEFLQFDDPQFANCNVGIGMGGNHNLIAIDVDVSDEDLNKSIERLLRDTLPSAPKRIGLPPKFLKFYRTEKPTSKQVVRFSKTEQVEILSEGQQVIAKGVHPDTRKSYDYPEDDLLDYRADELPLLTSDDLKKFMNALRKLSPYDDVMNDREAAVSGLYLKDITGSYAEAEAALKAIPNDDLPYDKWVNIVFAIKGSVGEGGRSLAHAWSSKSEKYQQKETDRLWNSINNVNRTGHGSLVYLAREQGVDVKPAKQPSEEKRRTRRPFQKISEVYYAEPIEWLVEGVIPRTGVGLISGATGSFKSFICGYLALCISNGVQFANRCETMQGRTLFAAHEGRIGMSGRLLAACQKHGLSESEFRLWDGVTLANDSDLQFLANESERFDFVVIDTLSKATPGIDENSNSDMAAAIDRAYQLADMWQAFVLVVAHTGKDSSKGTRGASALKANVDTVLLVQRSGKSMHTSLQVDKQKDGPDDLRFDFEMAEHAIVDGDGVVADKTELVPLPAGMSPAADQRIITVLQNHEKLDLAGIRLAVTSLNHACRYSPVTKDAIKVALSRLVKRQQVAKTGGKPAFYSLRGLVI